MGRLGLGLGLTRHRPRAAAGPAYGPELWPQPAFAASTGLTLGHSTISGGKWRPNGDESQASALSNAGVTAVAGEIYRYSVTIDANPAGDDEFRLEIGGDVVSLGNTPGTVSGDHTVVTGGSILRLGDPSNYGPGGALVSACSVKKKLN